MNLTRLLELCRTGKRQQKWVLRGAIAPIVALLRSCGSSLLINSLIDALVLRDEGGIPWEWVTSEKSMARGHHTPLHSNLLFSENRQVRLFSSTSKSDDCIDSGP